MTTTTMALSVSLYPNMMRLSPSTLCSTSPSLSAPSASFITSNPEPTLPSHLLPLSLGLSGHPSTISIRTGNPIPTLSVTSSATFASTPTRRISNDLWWRSVYYGVSDYRCGNLLTFTSLHLTSCNCFKPSGYDDSNSFKTSTQ